MTLPSEILELKEKINQLKQEKETIWYSSLRYVTEIINRSEFLTEDQKTKLLDAVWKKNS